MAHSRRFVGRRSPSLRTWFGQTTPANGVDLIGPGVGFSAGNKFFGTTFDNDVTILRTRGSVGAQIVPETGVVPGNTLSMAVGIGLITEEAAVAGAVPLPYENPDWDGWFYYETAVFVPYNTGLPNLLEGLRVQWKLDTKAMRKVQGGQVLALATQLYTGTGIGVAAVTVASIINIRALLKTS